MKLYAPARLPATVLLVCLGSLRPAAARDHLDPSNRQFSARKVIVIGFVGGLVRRNNAIHSEVQLADRLQRDLPSGAYIRMFENRRGSEARTEVLQRLDADHRGGLSAEEKSAARIVIYGHSWGASEAINLARELASDGIPVLLTVQVDSVAKLGEDDQSIPPNVLSAVNFYQRRGLIQGRSQIRAADASRTRILGNFRYDYKLNPVSCDGYPWYARVFMRPHIEIESDPKVWSQVETLIRGALTGPSPAP